MPLNSRKSRTGLALGLALVLAPAWAPADAGVLSGMIAKRRVQRQMKAEAKPTGISTLDGSVIGGPSSSSLTERFKRRFAHKDRANGVASSSSVGRPDIFSSDRDAGVFKTSR